MSKHVKNVLSARRLHHSAVYQCLQKYAVRTAVGINMIGPLQETLNGNKYTVGVTDHFSKWTEATGVPDKSAMSVTTFLYSVICCLGRTSTLISNQGLEFVNSIIDNLMERLQIHHRISRANHLQMASLNKTIEHWNNLLPNLSMNKEPAYPWCALCLSHICSVRTKRYRIAKSCQNATQIDPPCNSKCHMYLTYVRYKKPEVVWH